MRVDVRADASRACASTIPTPTRCTRTRIRPTRELRAEAPVYRNERLGFWALSRHADVLAGVPRRRALLQRERRLARPGRVAPAARTPRCRSSPWTRPATRACAALVSRGFTPRRIADLEPRIRELARQPHRRASSRAGRCDFIRDFAGTAADGRDQRDARRAARPTATSCARWADTVVHREDGHVPTCRRPAWRPRMQLLGYFAELVAEHRAHPRDDLTRRAARRRDRRRPAGRRRGARLPLPHDHRRQRDHHQAARQRRLLALAQSRAAPRCVARRSGADPALGRGDAALRRLDAGARPHGRRRRRAARRAPARRRPRRAARRLGQPRRARLPGRRSASTSGATPAPCCRSARARTSASARRSRGSRAASRSRRCSARFRGLRDRSRRHRARPFGERAGLRGACRSTSRREAEPHERARDRDRHRRVLGHRRRDRVRARRAAAGRVALGARRTDELAEVARAVESGRRPRLRARARRRPTPTASTRSSPPAEAALGPVDVVVSNAGVGVPGPAARARGRGSRARAPHQSARADAGGTPRAARDARRAAAATWCSSRR